jgi:deoxyribodipyrimidine photo-lyase
LVWFRRDLRLADNLALADGLTAGPVIPVFIWSPDGPGRPLGGAGRWWLDRSLRALAEDLARRGSQLVLRQGRPGEVLQALAAETGAGAVVYQRLYDPEEAALSAELAAGARAGGFEVRSVSGALLVEPGALLAKSGGGFQVFTPFWRAFQSAVSPPRRRDPPKTIPGPRVFPRSDALADFALSPTAPDWSTGFADWRPGEAGAAAALDAFLGGPLADYGGGRDRPDLVGTSMLSPHLHWGEISPAQAWRQAAAAAQAGTAPAREVEAFQRELAWREFNHHLLAARPDLPEANFKQAFDAFPWRTDPEGLNAWRRGRTGYPLVDAGMRQLWTTGWMHNRVRMIVASFLIKDLLIDWREGERWFWDTLLDADLANNVLNWQWVAGSGADAAPFFRIFNPISQGRRFDPDGAYVRRWVPELAGLAGAFVHAPHEAPPLLLKEAGVVLGRTYPHPVVDHGEARRRALEALGRTKAGA